MLEHTPQIAIVTVTYNDFNNLRLTIDSIRQHKLVYHKYYVIDGNSKDGTKDLIQENLDIIDAYISEKDLGIYDAMNKVDKLGLSDLSYILWLNAGDLLTDWREIDLNLLSQYNCAFFGVETSLGNHDKKKIVIPQILLPYNEKNFFPKTVFMHQGFLIRANTFKKYMYNTKIGLQAENLLMSTCILYEPFYCSNSVVAVYDLNGVSSTDFKRVLRSYLAVAKALKFNLIKLSIYQLNFLLRMGIKIMLPHRIFNSIRKIKAKI